MHHGAGKSLARSAEFAGVLSPSRLAEPQDMRILNLVDDITRCSAARPAPARQPTMSPSRSKRFSAVTIGDVRDIASLGCVSIELRDSGGRRAFSAPKTRFPRS